MFSSLHARVHTYTDIQTMYTLDSVITVVDAKVILDRLAEEKPEGVENESVEQVCFADKILLNKTDLADEPKLKSIEGEIRKLNPTAPILRCVHSKVTPKELLNIRAFDLQRVLDFDPEFLDPDQVSSSLCTSTMSQLLATRSLISSYPLLFFLGARA